MQNKQIQTDLSLQDEYCGKLETYLKNVSEFVWTPPPPPPVTVTSIEGTISEVESDLEIGFSNGDVMIQKYVFHPRDMGKKKLFVRRFRWIDSLEFNYQIFADDYISEYGNIVLAMLKFYEKEVLAKGK